MTGTSENDLIRKYATALVDSLIKKSKIAKGLENKQVKGLLREFFVSEALKPYLATQFGIGNGIIVNQRGDQSHQTDIIIYEKQILPPFIVNENIGIFPAESVLATIEVKSYLTRKELEKAELDARYLNEKIYNPTASDSMTMLKSPINSVFGFYGNGAIALRDETQGKTWLAEKAKNLYALCLAEKFTWTTNYDAGVNNPRQWETKNGNSSFNETKMFLAFVIDKIRELSAHRSINTKLPQKWI